MNVEYYDRDVAVMYLRKVRRRYVARALRNVAHTCLRAARVDIGTTTIVVASVAVITVALWL